MNNIFSNNSYKKNGYIVYRFPIEIKKEIIKFFLKKFKRNNVNDLEDYLSKMDDKIFKQTFTKPNRILGDSNIEKMFIDFVNINFPKGSFISQVSEYERVHGRNLNSSSLDIQIRCVRFKKSDVGPAHRDSQFWDLAAGTEKEPNIQGNYNVRTKIWVPIYGCSMTNSLQFLPGSHTKKIKTGYKNNAANMLGNVPFIDPDYLFKNEKKFFSPFQNFDDKCVFFHGDTIHRGVINEDTPLRISCELTVCSLIF